MLKLSFDPFPTLQTPRLVLRRIEEGDASVLFFIRSDEEMMRYVDRDKATSIDDALLLIQKIDHELESAKGITWGLALKEDPTTLVGTVGFWRIAKQHYRAEIGYSLITAYQGQGLMAEALRRVLQYGFGPMNLHSVEANINVGNAASEAALIRAGFVKEAHFRENFFYAGKFHDSVIYCKVKPS